MDNLTEMYERIRAEITCTYRLDPGQRKERAINDASLRLITTIVKRAAPTAHEVWFDWDQDGLSVTAIVDRQGKRCFEPDDVDENLPMYASNIQDSRYAAQWPRSVESTALSCCGSTTTTRMPVVPEYS